MLGFVLCTQNRMPGGGDGGGGMGGCQGSGGMTGTWGKDEGGGGGVLVCGFAWSWTGNKDSLD